MTIFFNGATCPNPIIINLSLFSFSSTSKIHRSILFLCFFLFFFKNLPRKSVSKWDSKCWPLGPDGSRTSTPDHSTTGTPLMCDHSLLCGHAIGKNAGNWLKQPRPTAMNLQKYRKTELCITQMNKNLRKLDKLEYWGKITIRHKQLSINFGLSCWKNWKNSPIFQQHQSQKWLTFNGGELVLLFSAAVATAAV